MKNQHIIRPNKENNISIIEHLINNISGVCWSFVVKTFFHSFEFRTIVIRALLEPI